MRPPVTGGPSPTPQERRGDLHDLPILSPLTQRRPCPKLILSCSQLPCYENLLFCTIVASRDAAWSPNSFVKPIRSPSVLGGRVWTAPQARGKGFRPWPSPSLTPNWTAAETVAPQVSTAPSGRTEPGSDPSTSYAPARTGPHLGLDFRGPMHVPLLPFWPLILGSVCVLRLRRLFAPLAQLTRSSARTIRKPFLQTVLQGKI